MTQAPLTTEDTTSVLTPQTSVAYPTPHQFRTLVCTKCGTEISIPIWCGNRFCETCSGPRRRRVISRIRFILDNITKKENHGLSHLVLTVQNSETIPDGFHHLLASFRRLRSYRSWRNHVLGGIFVLEVTGTPGKWHCHLHAAIQNLYWPQKEISKAWLKASGGSYCWIKRRNRKLLTTYLSKYLAKLEAPPELFEQISAGLRGFRLFQPFGTWLAVSKLWKKEVFCCKTCGQVSFIPLDIWYKFCHDYHGPDPGFIIKDEDRGEIGEPRESCFFTAELHLNAEAPAPF